ncbi:hypothetical protein F53441_8930 [Fusarium austroafricanum]|uniref:Uncharacterized protein n=1 Tax=Fusarium austroafricanum TaxID=2364996 RepID=A0A8H4KCK9_9HYPO|nr:hypothetical protein F53441_8930 [Fusarium austroafricanum]
MMGKFAFGGRKKQPPKVTVTAPPMSKAQKILGSTALNIDAPQQFDNFSSSKVNLAAPSAPETSPVPSHGHGNGHGSPVRHDRGMREWGDESEIVPRQFRVNGAPTDAYDDDMSDATSILRKRQSISTLHSWYDKSKQPLSISQQTSASAMAKGLPSKAERMLDMENSIAEAKLKKKKPAKLDLSHLMGRSRGKKTEHHWEGSMLGQVVRSPSILSPTSTPSLRGKLSRRPTKESLRSMNSEEAPRPKTGESKGRQHNHLNGLPNLYEHYEQMSFRSIIDDELDAPDEVERELKQKESKQKELKKSKSKDSHQLRQTVSHQSKHEHRPIPPSHHDEQIISQYAKRNLPQTPQAILASKPGQSSPTDCAASVSSRHTRTSKASKRTSRSFQESDLQEKSVLSLSSSDSEDDAYLPSSKGPASIPEYATSETGSSFEYRPSTARTSSSADNSSKRLSRSSKRTSHSANSNNYLTIPNGHRPVLTPRTSSLSGSSTNTIQEGTAGQSPSGMSSVSNLSENTSSTWESKPSSHSKGAKVVALYPDERRSNSPDSEQYKDRDSENDPEPELNFLPAMRYVPPQTPSTNTDAPTPPLSPSSVDFYIRSAHSSIDGKGSHNRFMAVTRQEEMLLAALRHKRQIMRGSILSEMEEENSRNEKKGHQSKPSEATITEESFDLDLDFPAPPTFKDKTTVAADGTTLIDLSHHTYNDNATEATNSTHHSHKKTHHEPKSHNHDRDQRERILLYIDKGLVAEHAIDEAEPSPDLSDFYDYEFDDESEDSSEIVPEAMRFPQPRRYSERKERQSVVKRQKSRSRQRSPHPRGDNLEVGVPRPDSPISPDALSTTAPRVNKKLARLSAVGPAKWGMED